MAFLKEYYSNRALYDVYDYPSDPPLSDVDLNSSLRSKIFPTGYNQNCGWPHDPENGIDYNIVNAPFRRFNNRINKRFSLNDVERTADPNAGVNLNSWNSGWPTAVVISDRHIATTQHFVGLGVDGEPPNSTSINNWMFFDTNGNTHEKIFDVPAGTGTQINARRFGDTVVYKLRDDQTGFIDSNIPIVNEIGDLYTLDKGTSYCLYCRDQMGKFFTFQWLNAPDDYPESFAIENKIDKASAPFDYSHFEYLKTFEGDSGSPCWIKLKNENYMFVGTMFGGSLTNGPPPDIVENPGERLGPNAIERMKELCAAEGSVSPMTLVGLTSGTDREADPFFKNPAEDYTYQTTSSDLTVKIKGEGNNQETNTLELNTSENLNEVFEYRPYIEYDELYPRALDTGGVTFIDGNTVISELSNLVFYFIVAPPRYGSFEDLKKDPPIAMIITLFNKETGSEISRYEKYLPNQSISRRIVPDMFQEIPGGATFQGASGISTIFKSSMVRLSPNLEYDPSLILGVTLDLRMELHTLNGLTGGTLGASIHQRNIVLPINATADFNESNLLPGQTFNVGITSDNTAIPPINFRFFGGNTLSTNPAGGSSFGSFLGCELFATGETTYTLKVPEGATTGDAFGAQILVDREAYAPIDSSVPTSVTIQGTVGGGS